MIRRGGLAIAALLLVACPGAKAPPPAPPEPAPAIEPIAEPAPSPALVQAVEAGFTHCCGNSSFRIEIDCGQMVKRCYSNETGDWRQTYGRHCRRTLGESCYLEDCDAKCQ
jgi:hypothetical protein